MARFQSRRGQNTIQAAQRGGGLGAGIQLPIADLVRSDAEQARNEQQVARAYGMSVVPGRRG